MKHLTIFILALVFWLNSATRVVSAEISAKVINVAVPAVSLLQAPLFVAIDAGAFKKYGMEVRYVVTGARTIQALIGGSVQFAQGVSSRTVPAAVLAGADAVLIANFSDKFLFTMHGAPEINSLQDLRGKIVGVSGIGGSTDFGTRRAVREAGRPKQLPRSKQRPFTPAHYRHRHRSSHRKRASRFSLICPHSASTMYRQ